MLFEAILSMYWVVSIFLNIRFTVPCRVTARLHGTGVSARVGSRHGRGRAYQYSTLQWRQQGLTGNFDMDENLRVSCADFRPTLACPTV